MDMERATWILRILTLCVDFIIIGLLLSQILSRRR